MKSLVLFYSYTGHTKGAAEGLAARESADIAEIKDARRPGKIKAFTIGCVAAAGGKGWPIQDLGVDLAAYDRLILLSPVWNGNPPPAVNAVLHQIPAGKSVTVKMNSGGGSSKCRERVEQVVKSQGAALESFEDIREQ